MVCVSPFYRNKKSSQYIQIDTKVQHYGLYNSIGRNFEIFFENLHFILLFLTVTFQNMSIILLEENCQGTETENQLKLEKIHIDDPVVRNSLLCE